MPDLFDSLRDLGDDAPITPASEVRRRGDRLRRRRHALQALGGAAAVAVVAAGTTLLLDGQGGAAPVTPVAGEPPGGWLREIPTHYALDRGWPDVDGATTTQEGPSQKFAPFTQMPVRACDATAYPSTYPVDSVGAVFYGADEDYRRRELTIYHDAKAATQVTEHLVDSLKSCDDGSSVGPVRLGDAAWEVRLGPPEQLGSQSFRVVRVGNGVLLDEGPEGASSSLAADMCIFASDPCSALPDEGPEVSPKIPALDKDALLTTDELTQELPGAWREIANREDPTLDCQADWLNQLGAEKAAFREWQSPDAEAATAVLEYTDVAAAEQAYEVVRSWVAYCHDRLPAVRPLNLSRPGKDFDYSTGPTYVRRVTAEAEAGRRWVDDQAVALTGRRIVLLSVATLTEDEIDPDPFHTVLAIASSRALQPQILGPQGYGDLELGMSAEEAEATGLVRILPGDGCRGVQLLSSPVTKSSVDGYLSDTYGLAALYGGITVERIAYGSTLDELKATYPGVRKEPSGWYADVDDEPQSTYFFGVEHGKVVAVSLQLKEQDCVS